MKLLSLLLVSITLLFANEGRIINGEEVSNYNSKYKAIAGLLDGGSFICGATMISPTWALTAAHCVINKSASSLTLLTNTYNISDASGTVVRVKKVVVHPQYNEDTSDIALLEVASSVQNYMSINRSDNFSSNDAMYVAGWGNTLIDGYDFPDALREVKVPYIDLSVCNGYNSYNNTLFDSQICAGYMSGLTITDSCQGDSGGPLVSEQNGDWVLSGIVSYGGSDTQACAAPNFPGIYTKVSSFKSWIDRTMSESEEVPNRSALATYINSLGYNEWFMLGTQDAVSDMSTFADTKIVLVYTGGKYKAYSPSSSIQSQLQSQGYEIMSYVPAYSGMWIKK